MRAVKASAKRLGLSLEYWSRADVMGNGETMRVAATPRFLGYLTDSEFSELINSVPASVRGIDGYHD